MLNDSSRRIRNLIGGLKVRLRRFAIWVLILATYEVYLNITGDAIVYVQAGEAKVVVKPKRLNVTEGKTATYRIRFATDPLGVATVSPQSVDHLVATVSGALTFDSSNWSTWQRVTVSGTLDDDDVDATTSIVHEVRGYGGNVSAPRVTVNVKDKPALKVNVAPTSINVEESGSQTYDVWLGSQPSRQVRVIPTSSDPNVLTVSGPLVFKPKNWDKRKTITVTALADSVASNETVEVSHAVRGGGSTSSAPSVTVNVIDKPSTRSVVVHIEPTALTVDENESQTYDVWLGSQPSRQVRVIATSSDSSVLAVSGSIVFKRHSWDKRKQITVTAQPDSVVDNKTVVVSHAVRGAGSTSSAPSVTVNVIDRPSTPSVVVHVEPTALTVDENESQTYDVWLGSQPSRQVRVIPTSSDPSVLTVSGSLVFKPTNWDKRKTITVTALADSVTSNETVVVSHAVRGGGSATNAPSVTVKVIDRPSTPSVVVYVEPTALTIDENESQTYDVWLGSQPSRQVRVIPTSSDLSVLTVSGSIVFKRHSWHKRKQITVTAQPDSVVDNETVVVSHSVHGGGSDASAPNVTVQVLENEESQFLDQSDVEFEIANASASEGDSGEADLTFNVSLSEPLDTTQTVNWATSKAEGDTAEPNVDYTAANGTLSFAAGETSKKVTVKIIGDEIYEADETLTVTLSGASGGITIRTAAARGTIKDDDERGLELTRETVTVTEASGAGRTASYEVSLATQPTATVTVSVSSDDESVATVSPATLTFTTTDWQNGQSVTVTGVDDDVDSDPDRTTTIEHTASGGDYGAETASVAVTLTDDDSTPTVSLALSKSSITETDDATTNDIVEHTTTVTAQLSGASSAAVTVDVAATTASGNGEYELSTNTRLTIAAGSTSSTGTVTITATDNDVDAPDTTVTVAGTASGGGVADPTSQTLTITDDDERGLELTRETVTVTEASGAGRTASYEVSLATQPTATVTVSVSSDDESVATVSPATLTFTTTDWQNGQSVTVTGVDDDVDSDPDRTTTIEHTASGGDYGAETASVAVTLTDDDSTPTVSLALSKSSITETDDATTNDIVEHTTTVTAQLSGASSAAVTVDVAATTASGNGEYELSTNTRLTIAAGSTSSTGTVTITATDNDVDAPDTTVTVAGTASGGGVADPTSQTLTITDDDERGLELTRETVTVTEASGAGRTASYEVSLATQPTATVTVSVSSDDESVATVSPATLTFTTTDWQNGQSVTVTGVDDDVDSDPDRTTTIEHTASGGDYGAETASVAVTLTDDDSTPTVSLALSKSSITETDDATTNDIVEHTTTVTAQLSGASSAAVTVDVAATTASGNGEYELSTNTRLTIAAGSTSSTGTVTITATDNDVDAPDTTVTVAGTASGGGVADPTSQTLTITDDDERGLELTRETVTVTEASGAGRTASYEVSLATQPTATVTVSVSSDDESVATVSPATLTFTTTDWQNGQSVTVTGVDDDVDSDPDRTTTIEHTASGGDYGAETASVAVTLTDDDERGLKLSADTVTINLSSGSDNSASYSMSMNADASNRGRTASYTVALTSKPTASVTVNLSSGNENVATISPATLTFTTTNWQETQSVTVTAVTDDDSLPLMASISHTAVGGDYGKVTGSVAVFVRDDDGSPTFFVRDAQVVEGNSGTANLIFTITLSPAADSINQVNWSTSDDTATAGVDYTAATGLVRLNAGESSETFTVSVNGDVLDEGDETLTVTLSESRRWNEGNLLDGPAIGRGTATGTITDDDAAPVLSLVLSKSSIVEMDDANTNDIEEHKTTVTAALSHASGAPTEVTVSVEPVPPASTSDYRLSTNTVLTIAAGETASTGTVTVTAVDNSVVTRDKQLTVKGVGSNTLGVTNPADATLTIVEDDDALVLSTSHVFVWELIQTVHQKYKVSLASNPAGPVTVTPVSGDNTKVAVSGPLKFDSSNWSIGQSVTLTGVEDDDGYNHQVVIDHAVTGYDPPSASVRVTVRDYHGKSVLINPLRMSIVEGETGTYSVRLRTNPSNTVTVTPSVEDSKIATVSDTLTFNSNNWSVEQYVTVTGVRDHLVEERNTTVNHTVTGYEGYRNTYPGGWYIHGTDNPDISKVDLKVIDLQPRLTFVPANVRVSEASGTDHTATFNVGLAKEPTSEVRVRLYFLRDAGVVSLSPTELTFSPENWQVSQRVTVTGIDDDVDNDPERTTTIRHAASGGGYNEVFGGVGVAVTDDDERGLTLSRESLTLTEATGTGRTASYKVALTSEPTSKVTVNLSPNSEDVARVSPSSLVYTSANWQIGQTVTVTSVDDDIDNDVARATTIAHTASGGDYGSVTGSIAVTVTDDDDRGLTISEDSVKVTEAAGDNRTASYTVALASQPTATVTVSLSSGDEDAATVSPATLTFTNGDWSVPQSVTVTAVDDEILTDRDAYPRKTTITHTASGGDYGEETGSVAVTVVEDEGTPTFSIANAEVAEGDEGTSDLTFTVTLSPAAGYRTQVRWSTSDDTATAGTDYTAAYGGLLFRPGETTKTFTVKVIGDLVTEDDETLNVSLSDAGYWVGLFFIRSLDGGAVGQVLGGGDGGRGGDHGQRHGDLHALDQQAADDRGGVDEFDRHGDDHGDEQ